MEGREAYRAARRAPRGFGLKLALTTLVIGLLGPLAVANAAAAFDADGRGPGLQPGPAPLTSRQLGAPLTMPNGGPGDAETSFVEVAHRDREAGRVVLFGTTGGTGLDRHLLLTVTRGSGDPTTFAPDPVDYAGEGPGVVFRGPLAAFPDDRAGGLADPAGPWGPGETVTFRFDVRMTGTDGAQGLTATQTFSWAVEPVA